MANEVKVSFVGDTSDLSKKLDKLESDVEDTAKEIDNATRSTRSLAADGFDRVADAGDRTERRFRGLKDSITGTGDVMTGLRDGNVVTLAAGLADLGGAVADLGADMLDWGKKAFEAGKKVVEAHAASVAAKAKDIAITAAHKAASIASTVATQAQAGAQWALNAAMSANPIVLVVAAIAALTAGVILAYQHSETFRDIVDSIGRFFRDELWPAIQKVTDKVIDFGKKVGEVASTIAGWVANIVLTWWDLETKVLEVVAKILGVFKDLGEKLLAPFQWAFGKVKEIYDHSIGPIIDAIKSIGPGNGGFGGGLDPDKVRRDLEQKAGLPPGSTSAGYSLGNGAGLQPVQVVIDGRVLGEAMLDINRRWA